MPLLYGFVFAVVPLGIPLLLLALYRRGGLYGVTKGVLVLWGILSGAMWFMAPWLMSESSGLGLPVTSAMATLSVLPWGAIWIIDTALLVCCTAYEFRSGQPSAAG